MNIYRDFATLYAQGEYNRFSARMAKLLPDILAKFNLKPNTILDVACGEGTFAIKMAEKGYEVTGIDLSPEMLQIARKKAQQENMKIDFRQGDMRELSFDSSFDLVTCWFDSLNYLLDLDDLEKTFCGVSRALKRDRAFIFDMNTIYGLEVEWQNPTCHIQQDSPRVFEVHRTRYSPESHIAVLTITGFIKKSKGWKKIEEEHRERGYSLEEIRECIRNAGLTERACWDNLEMGTKPDEKSGRVWFVAQKK